MARPSLPRKAGLLSTVFGGFITHPTAAFGGLVMTAAAAAIIVNALVMQHGAHPAPLFVGTRPWTSDQQPAVAPNAPAAPKVTTTDAVDHGLVADIQRSLRDFGYYKGDIDGLPGPQTSQAILAFERAFHLAPTGEPSNNVLLALRSVRPKSSSLAPAASEDPMTVSALPSSSPVPVPKPSRGGAQPVTTDQQSASAGPRSIADLISASSAPAATKVSAVAQPATVAQPAVTPAPAVQTAAAKSTPVTTTATDGSDPRLARIQQSLASQGFGPLEVNGHMNQETREAIRNFESYYGLPVTGSINETFLTQLVKVGGLNLD